MPGQTAIMRPAIIAVTQLTLDTESHTFFDVFISVSWLLPLIRCLKGIEKRLQPRDTQRSASHERASWRVTIRFLAAPRGVPGLLWSGARLGGLVLAMSVQRIRCAPRHGVGCCVEAWRGWYKHHPPEAGQKPHAARFQPRASSDGL